MLEEFTDCETDVFIHFYPPQRLSLNNISLCGFGFCILSRGRGGGGGGGGCHMAARSTKHVISINRDWPWGCLLLWCDLLVSVTHQFSLEWLFVWRRGRGRGGTWEGHKKRDCCGFRKADGAVHQMGVWGANKLVDLEAGTGTVNTASSRIWSAQMLPVKYCESAALKCLNHPFLTFLSRLNNFNGQINRKQFRQYLTAFKRFIWM